MSTTKRATEENTVGKAEHGEAEPFTYEGRGCWIRAAAEGAAGLAAWGALAVLVWRVASRFDWLSFHPTGAVAVMVLSVVMGAGIGLAEHHGACHTPGGRQDQDSEEHAAG